MSTSVYFQLIVGELPPVLVRGKNGNSSFPHIYESTRPNFLMSKTAMKEEGLKMSPGQQPVGYSFNYCANQYHVYDARQCSNYEWWKNSQNCYY